MDINLARFVLNYYVSMFDLLKRNGYHPTDTGNMMCPFHYNTHSPAAKMYHDENGWCLWCFNEKRIFTTWDVYDKLLNINPMILANKLWDKMSVEKQQEMINMCGSQVEFEGDIPYLDDLNEFQVGKITYKQLCERMAFKL